MNRLLMRVAAAAPALLVACTTPTVNVTQYDLGLPPASAALDQRAANARTLAEVSAPAWLDNPSIAYRLAYDDANQVHGYAQSRWVAAPASLLVQRLRERLPITLLPVIARADTTLATDYLLQVELDEFSQVFDTPQASRALLRARATLIDLRRHELIAQRVFEVQRPAAPPNALGAVLGLRDAVDEFITELLRWTDQESIRAGAPLPQG
ncbi:putative lipoprotein [Burkholderiales bacterium]|nr:putative lipoprotein [Burkholderiales bacterium]